MNWFYTKSTKSHMLPKPPSILDHKLTFVPTEIQRWEELGGKTDIQVSLFHKPKNSRKCD